MEKKYPRMYLIGHGLANFLCFAASLLPAGSIPGFTFDPGGAHEFQPLWLDATGVAALALGAYALKKHFERQRPLPSDSPGAVY